MDALSNLTLDHFSGHIGESFTADTPQHGVTLVLSEASALGEATPQASDRAPFSLIFTGPHDAPLSQGCYSLSHPGVGRQVIFLVPLGPRENGMRYQAIFS